MNQLWQWFFGRIELMDVGPICFEDRNAAHDLLIERKIYFESGGSDHYGSRFLVEKARIAEAQRALEECLGKTVSVCPSYSTGDF